MKRALLIGNSDGIGLCLTQTLLKENWQVTGISRSPSPLDQETQYQHIIQDVLSDDFPETLGKVANETGPFDVCVFCVGIAPRLHLGHMETEVKVFEVNLMGALKTLEVLLPKLIEQGTGHIIMLSSIADNIVSNFNPAYCASKAGMTSYLRGLGLALKEEGITLTNIRFGFVDTKMAKAPFKPFQITPEKAAQVILKAIDKKPLQITYPKVMGMAAQMMKIASTVKIWAG